MKLSEITLTINKYGRLNIPAALLREMGLSPGDHVRLAYLTKDGKANTFQEFLLSTGPDQDTDTDGETFSVPICLLQQAGIPPDSDLQIICLDKCLMICQDMSLQPEELSSIQDTLRITDDLTHGLPGDTERVLLRLDDMIQAIQVQRGEIK